MASYGNNVTSPTFFTQKMFLPKTVMTHFGWNFLLVGVFRHRPSQKTTSKELTGKRETKFFWIVWKISDKLLSENQKFAFFSKISNVKVPFFKFIGSIAVFRIQECLQWLSNLVQSVHELWPIINSKATSLKGGKGQSKRMRAVNLIFVKNAMQCA